MHERLGNLRDRLAALPGFEAPAAAWQEVVAAHRAPAIVRRGYGPPALAAAAMLAVIGVAVLAPRAPATAPVAERPAVFESSRARNARLEEVLAALPARSAMRGSTAFTVAVLEDRLALVDDRLTMSALEAASPEQAAGLWREREELLNSLVQVRYAEVAGAL